MEEAKKVKAIHILVRVWHVLAFTQHEARRKRSQIKVTDKFKEGLKLRKRY